MKSNKMDIKSIRANPLLNKKTWSQPSLVVLHLKETLSGTGPAVSETKEFIGTITS